MEIEKEVKNNIKELYNIANNLALIVKTANKRINLLEDCVKDLSKNLNEPSL